MARSKSETIRIYGPWSFRAWGYGLRCLVVGCETTDYRPGRVKLIEQCHTTNGGTGRKAGWQNTCFMCWRHHDESHRGVRTFEEGNRLRIGEVDVATLKDAAIATQALWKIHEEGLE